jgi:hypothetical protein
MIGPSVRGSSPTEHAMRKIFSLCLTAFLTGTVSVLAGCITINILPPPDPLEEEVFVDDRGWLRA